MNSKFLTKAIACCLAALLQTGVAVAASEETEIMDAGSDEDSKSLRFDSSWLGLNGPIQVTTTYNDEYGVIVGANFATYVNASNALAFEAEVGTSLYRINGTWGHAINERNRIKVSLERLAQKDDYDFASGTENEWVGQNAIGIGYQYIVADGWLQAIDVNAYGAQAESVDFDDVLFYDGSGNAQVNKRRITGGLSSGASVGMTIKPWEKGRWETALHYDAVSYDMQYSDDDPSTSGFGISNKLEHVFGERVKGNVSADMLSTSQTYAAGISWLVPTEVGSRLELAFNTGYFSSGSTDDSNFQVGVQASYGWDEGPSGDVPRYTGFGELGIEDLKSWTRDPAVRMPEVMAVVDEAVVDAGVVKNADLPDVSRQEESAIDLSVASYFSSPDGSALSYEATGLPSGITLNAQGTFEGMTPNVDQDTDYSVTVTASNRWGFSQSDNFILTVLEYLAPPQSNGIADQSLEELTQGVIDISVFFVDPNAQASAKTSERAQRRAKADDDGFTYSLVKPGNWNTPLTINESTGVIAGTVPAYQNGGNNSYPLQVTASNYAGSVTESFSINVIDEAINVVADEIPVQSFTEGVYGESDLSQYFSNQSDGGGDITFSVEDAVLNDAGLTVTSAGLLEGTPTSIEETKTLKTSVKASNAATDTVRLLTINIEASNSAVIDVTQPDKQSVIGGEAIDQSSTLDLNTVFTHNEGDALVFTSDNLSQLGSGVYIDENGFILGTPDVVTENAEPIITVVASNEAGTQTATADIAYEVLAQPTSEAVPLQVWVEHADFSLDVTQPGNGNFQPAEDLTFELSNAPAGWGVDDNGVITGEVPEYNLSGNNAYQVTVIGHNISGNSQIDLTTEQTFVLNVDNSTATDIPVGEVPPPQTLTEGQAVTESNAVNLNEVFDYNEDMTFEDVNGDLQALGLQISNGYIVGIPNVVQNEDRSVTIRAVDTDESGVTGEVNIQYIVHALPESSPIADIVVYEYQAQEQVSMDVNDAQYGAFEPADDLVYSVSGNMPSGWVIDSATGVISGQVPTYNASGGSAANTYSMTVVGQNELDTQLSTSQSFSYIVEPSSITGDDNASFYYESGVQVSEDLNSLLDYSGDDLSFSLNDSDQSALATTGLNLSSDGVISGTSKYVAEDTSAIADIAVLVTNNAGAEFTINVDIKVQAPGVIELRDPGGIVLTLDYDANIYRDLNSYATYKVDGETENLVFQQTANVAVEYDGDENGVIDTLSISTDGILSGTTDVDDDVSAYFLVDLVGEHGTTVKDYKVYYYVNYPY